MEDDHDWEYMESEEELDEYQDWLDSQILEPVRLTSVAVDRQTAAATELSR